MSLQESVGAEMSNPISKRSASAVLGRKQSPWVLGEACAHHGIAITASQRISSPRSFFFFALSIVVVLASGNTAAKMREMRH